MRRAAQVIDAGYRKSTPWWGRCDLNEAHIRRAADGRLVLIDVFCMDGASLYREILEDVAGVHRRIPRERMRYALDIPYIARRAVPPRSLPSERPGHALPDDRSRVCQGTADAPSRSRTTDLPPHPAHILAVATCARSAALALVPAVASPAWTRAGPGSGVTQQGGFRAGWTLWLTTSLSFSGPSTMPSCAVTPNGSAACSLMTSCRSASTVTSSASRSGSAARGVPLPVHRDRRGGRAPVRQDGDRALRPAQPRNLARRADGAAVRLSQVWIWRPGGWQLAAIQFSTFGSASTDWSLPHYQTGHPR